MTSAASDQIYCFKCRLDLPPAHLQGSGQLFPDIRLLPLGQDGGPPRGTFPLPAPYAGRLWTAP